MLRPLARGEANLEILDLETPHLSQAPDAEPLSPAQNMLVDIRGWTRFVRVKATEL